MYTYGGIIETEINSGLTDVFLAIAAANSMARAVIAGHCDGDEHLDIGALSSSFLPLTTEMLFTGTQVQSRLWYYVVLMFVVQIL